MLSPKLHFRPSLLSLCIISIVGCGGGGESDSGPAPVLASPPTISVTVNSTTIDEGSSVTISHSAKDYLGNSLNSTLSCDAGSLTGNIFTAPTVSADKTVTCIVTATDSGNRSATESISIDITNLAPLVTMTADTSAAAATLTSFDVSFANVPAGYIDAKMNGEDIKIGVTADNKLVYLPAINVSGQQTLELNIDGETVSHTFDVSPITEEIVDPLAYVTDYFTTLTNTIDDKLSLPVTNLTTVELQAMQSLKSFLETSSYTSLNNDELTLLAHILRNNQQQFEIDQSVGLASYSAMSGTSGYAVSSAALSDCEKVAIMIVASAAATSELIVASGALAASGVGSSVSLAALVAGGATLGLTLTGIEMFPKYCFEPVEASIDELGNVNTTNTTQYLSSLSTAGKMDADPISLVFTDGKPKQFHLNQEYNLLDGAGSFMTNVNLALNKFKSVVYTTIDLLGQYSPPVLSDLVDVIKSYGTEYSEILESSKVSLTNFNGTNISSDLFTSSDDEQTFSLVFDFIDETKIPASGKADFTFTIENTSDGIAVPVNATLYNSDVPDIVFIWNGQELGADTTALEAVLEVIPGQNTTQDSFQILNKGERAIELSKVNTSNPAFTLSNLNSATLDSDQQLSVNLQFALQPSNKTTTVLTFGQNDLSDFDRSFSVNAIINYAGGYQVEVVESTSVEECQRDPRTSTYALAKTDYETYTLAMSDTHTATFRSSGSSITASGSHIFAEDEGITNESYNISINYKGEVSGSTTWSWKRDDNGLSCSGTTSINGNRG